ncbi:MAG: hypothetical protein PVJ76_04400 [Gemmatimonadota bacterium]|jgi:hypothetical protein
MIKRIFRRLRGAAGNALVWAGTWSLAAFPLAAVSFLVFGAWGKFPFWPSALGMAQTMAGLGLFAGAGFSLYLGITGRKRRLDELKPGWVALGTSLAVGLLVPIFGVYFGDAPVDRALEIASYTAVLSGFTALAQVKIAQKALSPGEDRTVELEAGPDRSLPDPKAKPV